MTERININKDNLIWAIERAGFEVDEFLEKNPLVESWIDATKQPTLRQLEVFAHHVSVPFGYLFLQEHPKEEIPIAFFRTKKGHKPFNLNVYDTIMMLQSRQDWVSEQKEEEGCDRLDFVGKYTIHSSLREVVNDVRGLLHYSPDWAFDKKDQAKAVRELTKAIENVGCFVSFLTQVGNQSTRKISVEDCRGFALCDPYAPFIFINNSDSNTAQVFTLLHEFTHLLLGQSAGDGNVESTDNETEKFCDAVAGHVLVDGALLCNLWSNYPKNYGKFGRKFCVSPLVIAFQALDNSLITEQEYWAFFNLYTSNPIPEKKGDHGGDSYRTAIKRLGYSFLTYVRNAVKSNRLLYSDAYSLTGYRGNTFEKLIDQKL